MTDERTVEQFASQGEFRAWLAANYAASEGIWLKIAKKGGAVSTVTYDEALEVALIYGWIDGQKRPQDATFWLQGFTRRGPRSAWSKRNREKAQALIDAGLMEPSGFAEVDQAKADGRWANAYDGQRDAQEPPDLMAALAAKPAALRILWNAQQRESLRNPVSDPGCEAPRNQGGTHRQVCRDAGSRREDLPVVSALPAQSSTTGYMR